MKTGMMARGALAALFVAVAGSPALAQDPRFNPPVSENRWMLGVSIRNVPNGATVTAIAPDSPASDAGFELGDIILSVNGTPVGFVNGQLWDLADALNQQADSRGRVSIRLRDGRTGRVRNANVRLDPAPGGQPPILPPPIQPPGGIRPPGPPPGVGNPALATVMDWYRRYLERDMNAFEIRSHLDLFARGTQLSEIHAGIIGSSEYFDKAGNRPRLFVQRAFQDVVGRPPTPFELSTWTDRLLNVDRGNRVQFARTFIASLYRG